MFKIVDHTKVSYKLMGNFFKNYFSFYSPETAIAVTRIQIDLKNIILYYYMYSTKGIAKYFDDNILNLFRLVCACFEGGNCSACLI